MQTVRHATHSPPKMVFWVDNGYRLTHDYSVMDHFQPRLLVYGRPNAHPLGTCGRLMMNELPYVWIWFEVMDNSQKQLNATVRFTTNNFQIAHKEILNLSDFASNIYEMIFESTSSKSRAPEILHNLFCSNRFPTRTRNLATRVELWKTVGVLRIHCIKLERYGRLVSPQPVLKLLGAVHT